ncbi:hypothetical protein [Streptomyces sp. NBC_01428]|uniref:hypothetical protein n=1 Tax=Streptomyces sp. NBC_01428 TaxID=2903861 RepID=UPI002E37FE0C|nr:hypothetical protein [Streptomyces sp. NBC_01428]
MSATERLGPQPHHVLPGRLTVRQGEALALLGDAGRVTGVRVVAGAHEEDLDADLVVDASGRGSRAE